LQACVQCQQFQSGPLMDQTDEMEILPVTVVNLK
jgi:hypothetical protein